MRKEAVRFLKEIIPVNYWSTVWWFVPSLAIFLLPLELALNFLLGKLGFAGVGRLTQLLILFSLLYGVVSGVVVLGLANFSGLSESLIYKVKWLSRFAIVSPLLTLLILFLIFSR